MRRRGLLLALLACSPDDQSQGPPDGGCEEPNPRDPKGLAEDEPCETSFDCRDPNLVCLGIGPERQPVCTPPTDLWDPGCYELPEVAAVGHCDDPDRLQDVEIAERVGCTGTLSTYEIPDRCCRDAHTGDCRFDCTDFLRREIWRNCGCCWRMVTLVEVQPGECP